MRKYDLWRWISESYWHAAPRCTIFFQAFVFLEAMMSPVDAAAGRPPPHTVWCNATRQESKSAASSIKMHARTHTHTPHTHWNGMLLSTTHTHSFLLSHTGSPVRTQEVCMKRSRHVRPLIHKKKVAPPTRRDRNPSPLSGTWHGQCLAVDSCWQQSWKHNDNTKILATGTQLEA